MKMNRLKSFFLKKNVIDLKLFLDCKIKSWQKNKRKRNIERKITSNN